MVLVRICIFYQGEGNLKNIAIIPARMGSSRFPGKPMELINGLPMIEHVYNRVKKNSIIDEVFVATCDNEISKHIKNIGANAIMTSKDHERCTARCSEALKKIEKKYSRKISNITMVQGDEPMIVPQMISQSIKPILKNNKVEIVNLLGKISSKKEFLDKNCIKVIYDKNFNALYFSRLPIPINGNYQKSFLGKQVCVISFKRKALLDYLKIKPSIYEKYESVDMMRYIEQGRKILMKKTNYQSFAVDTPKDLEKVARLMKLKK